MRNEVKVKANLEAEDTLAVRLKSLEVKADWTEGPIRQTLERQAKAILDQAALLEGGLALIEVDGVSNAVLLRSPKPNEGRFVQVVLRNGNSIELDAHGGSVHLAREKYEELLELMRGLFE
ncbi:MAG TPA: hypothetical protein VFE29_07380 [Terriglobia bacterium]|nr:hypothetical protein [Terriglobia bacterium]